MAKKGGVVIKVNNAALTAKRLQAVYEKGALPQLAQEILQDCNIYCPKREGTLQESAHLEKGGKEIVWDTKYAAIVYFTGKNISKTPNPNASIRWCEVAKRNHSQHWADSATKLLQRK